MRYLISALIAACLILAAACGDDDDATPSPTQSAAPTQTTAATPSASPNSSAGPTARPTATIAPTPLDICEENPDPASSSELVIDAPEPGDEVSSPVIVSGEVLAFEAVFRIAIKDAAGTDIADVGGMADEGQVLSPFEESVPFVVSEATPACIWVYQNSAMDGSIVNVGQVPVTLVP